MLRHLDCCLSHVAGECPSAAVRKSSTRSLKGDAGPGAIGRAQTVPRFTLADKDSKVVMAAVTTQTQAGSGDQGPLSSADGCQESNSMVCARGEGASSTFTHGALYGLQGTKREREMQGLFG